MKRRWLAQVLVLASCSVFESEFADDDDGYGHGGHDDGGYDDGGSWSCGGTAYTRTDVPGTGVCLDAGRSFTCSWRDTGSAFYGVRVEGSHDASGGVVTWRVPDDPEASSYTDLDFDVSFGDGGHDMVLRFMGSRSGEYREAASWADALAAPSSGDSSVCNGGGGGGGHADGGDQDESETCVMSCSSSVDCGPGESCLDSEIGFICLPSSCQSCWDVGETCTYDASSCGFVGCGEGGGADGGDEGGTCRHDCEHDGHCSAGLRCYDTSSGSICLSLLCELCFEEEQACSSDVETCEFSHCE
jgi:hypothetical protein